MNGLISSVKRMEIHDGDGLRTTVFFKGCPMKCIWCHNPESISFERQTAFFEDKCIRCGACRGEKNDDTAKNCPAGALVSYGTEYSADELADILAEDEAFFKNSGGGVTLSGGECLSQPAFAAALAKNLFERGISVYIDTCGCVSRASFEAIIPFADKFLYDIKAVDPIVHKKCTGRDNALILSNLKFLSGAHCDIEIRYPLVTGYNDGECEKIGALLEDMQGVNRVKVLQYHRFAASRYAALGLTNTLPDTKTTYADVETAVKILKSHHLNAVNGITED